MKSKAKLPQSKRVMEDAATIKTSRESTPILEPGPKRRRLERIDSGPFIVLDEHGDLRLFVGAAHVDRPSTYRVCSKALARSSPVMERMIYGGSVGSPSSQDPQSDRIIHFTDDEPAAMHLMLQIIHGDFRRIPQTMELQTLHNLVVIMDRYDTLSLTRPWVRSWLAGVRTSGDYGKLLSVACMLGDIDLFNTTSARLIESCAIDEEGYLVVNSDIPASDPLGANTEEIRVETAAHGVPESVFNNLEIRRAQRISEQVAPFRTLYKSLARGYCECRSTSSFTKEMSPRCRALALGSLVQGLLEMGINVTMSNPNCAYRGSLSSLADQLDDLEILTGQNCDMYSHDECAQMLKAAKHRQPTTVTYVESEVVMHLIHRGEDTGLLD
ncbi:hypothetical protein LZ30DRAFT_651579 [Colletotrichum cereale]|nr:hypothetical protein LZ30DRAFT_651579 [Colletotrichum cereale]